MTQLFRHRFKDERRFRYPLSLNSLLNAFRTDAVLGPAVRCGLLVNKWEEIVGAKFAKRVTPVEVKNETLYVLAHNSAWAHEFIMISDFVRKNVKKLTGVSVEKIRCKTGGCG